ncbi:Receptor-interacting serine/threonine-protein kinase 4 [Daphnia magna]|uniref:Receptor-interacting serine/threonine-protein kinase 4 n=1 Tax=Daphnia magna TaxID=35525 RepID=A0A162NAG1_9CRUS|nr:Receptor-interacting serine/threonine-protein kinase 4 [Daphnia magna]
MDTTFSSLGPNGALAPWNLTEIDINANKLALELINLVTDVDNPFTFEAGTLLRHPFFIRYCQFALSRLIKEQANEEIVRRLKISGNLLTWKKSLGNGRLPNENFSDLERILFSENRDMETSLTEAFKRTPQLLSQYIWHVSTNLDAIPEGNNQISTLEKGEFLGLGSYGKVYKCYYTNKDGIRVLAACKKALFGKDDAGKVFEREIRTLSQLNHLFVTKYLEVVEKDGKKFLVMELCDGSLKQYVLGELEPAVPAGSLDDKIISQVSHGLAYMHSKGIIHKDLKLENILLKRHSPASCLVLAKIADFGFAKELKPESSGFSLTIHPGTESYMAPELLLASSGTYPADFLSDVYALGIIITRIVLKGDHPFTNDRNRRKASMVQGLVPPNLQHHSWDLIDLIVKLTDKDPAKRPIMPLVLCHPYFTLTNDKTKRHFVDQLLTDLNSENRRDQMKKIFNNHNFQEWYNTIITDKPETAEETQEMEKTLEMFKSIQPDSTVESLYPARQYKQTIKNALKAEYDANVGNEIDQISSNHGLCGYDHSKNRTMSRLDPTMVFKEDNSENEDHSGNQTNQKTFKHYLQQQFSRNRLHKMVEKKPVLMVSYFWSCLADMINNPPINVSTTTTGQQKPTSSGGRKHQLAQLKNWITNELQWASLFYDDDEQIADELWNMKYPGTNEPSQEKRKEIIRTAAKCNISTAVWSELLKWMEKNAAALLREVVQSHVPNAPKIAEMILQKHWFKEEKLSSFHLAAFNEGTCADKIMEALFDNKRIPTVTEDGLSPAHIAAQNESNCGWKMLKLLLDNGADPNASFQNGTSPVHWAAMNQGNYAAEILKYLLDHGGDSEKIDKNGLKPIHYATLNTSDSAVKLLDLLLKNRGTNVVKSTGSTLLHLAVLNEGDRDQGILKKLLENRENPNVGDNEGRIPLHLAISDERIQQVETIRLLLRYRSNPNAVDQSGLTPVHYAAANEGEHASKNLQLLLAFNGSLAIKDKDGLTPIHYTITNRGKYGDEMRKLVGVNPAKTNAHLNSNGETLLHRLVSKNDGQLELVQLVIDNGGNPNATDKFGRSPVHSVVMLNESLAGLDILRLLLAKGGNVNLQDRGKKFTPVHYVASSLRGRLPEKMKILLNSGGDVNVEGNDGITPLHLAVANLGIYGPQLTRMLLKSGANVNAIDANQRTPLHEAIRNENDDISFDAIQQLVEKGANSNAHDGKGLTPVHYAVQYRRSNSIKVMKLLLQHGGNLNIADNKGMTPQRLAEYFLPPANKNLSNEE